MTEKNPKPPYSDADKWQVIEQNREQYAAIWNEATRSKTDVPMMILSYMAQPNNRNGVFYDELSEATDTSRRRVRQYVANLEMHGVVDVEHDVGVATISFASDPIRLLAGEIVKSVREYNLSFDGEQ